jgi:hypothetical protein
MEGTPQERKQSCRHALAILLTIPTVLMLLIALGALHIRMTFFSADFLKRVLGHQDLSGRIPIILCESMMRGRIIDTTATNGFQDRVDSKSLEAFAIALFPPDWFQENNEKNIDAMFAWLEGKTAYPEIYIPYRERRTYVESEEARSQMRDLLSSLPPCTPGDDFSSDHLPQCLPPNMDMEQVISEAQLSLEDFFSSDFSFEAAMEGDEESDDYIMQYFQAIQADYRIATWTIWAIWSISLFLLCTTLILAARNLESLLWWFGWPVSVTGGLSLVLLITLNITVPSAVTSWFTGAASEIDANSIGFEIFSKIAEIYIHDFLLLGLYIAGAVLLLGGCSIFFSILLRRFRGI